MQVQIDTEDVKAQIGFWRFGAADVITSEQLALALDGCSTRAEKRGRVWDLCLQLDQLIWKTEAALAGALLIKRLHPDVDMRTRARDEVDHFEQTLANLRIQATQLDGLRRLLDVVTADVLA